MADQRITGWRPRAAEVIYVCEKCGIVVQPDRDSCPNGPGLMAEIGNAEDAHHLTSFIRRDSPDQRERDAAARYDHAARSVALHAIEAARACLDTAQAGLDG